VALVRATATTSKQGEALAKQVRVAIDSRPPSGAGRVEDTINLLGHAARVIVRIVSKLLKTSPERICREASCRLLLERSIKAGLDIDWSNPRQEATAIDIVERQVSSLQAWVEKHLDDDVRGAIESHLQTLDRVKEQDLINVNYFGRQRQLLWPVRTMSFPACLHLRRRRPRDRPVGGDHALTGTSRRITSAFVQRCRLRFSLLSSRPA
jgi:hypothetical protein